MTLDHPLIGELNSIDRRSFLRSGLTAAGFILAANRGPLSFAQTAMRRLAPVRVSRDRIIREIVGLRPYRPEGFVVEAQKLGSKLLIHNYGHGGAGVTLSWGCAREVVALAGR